MHWRCPLLVGFCLVLAAGCQLDRGPVPEGDRFTVEPEIACRGDEVRLRWSLRTDISLANGEGACRSNFGCAREVWTTVRATVDGAPVVPNPLVQDSRLFTGVVAVPNAQNDVTFTSSLSTQYPLGLHEDTRTANILGPGEETTADVIFDWRCPDTYRRGQEAAFLQPQSDNLRAVAFENLSQFAVQLTHPVDGTYLVAPGSIVRLPGPTFPRFGGEWSLTPTPDSISASPAPYCPPNLTDYREVRNPRPDIRIRFFLGCPG